MRAVRAHAVDAIAVLALVLLALAVGGYITQRQRMTLPDWVPVLGDDRELLHAELEDGKSLVPGQGQAVTVAGVEIGEVTGVRLSNGRAVVTMEIEPGRAQLHRDATALVRPRTALEDMVVELSVGTPEAGPLPWGATLPVSRTSSPVQVDQILASLDLDTRERLLALVSGAGRTFALGGDRAASRTLRRFEPLAADLRGVGGALARRRSAVSGVVRSLALLGEEVGRRDDDLATLVSASDEALAAFARQDRALRHTIARLPGALSRTDRSLQAVDEVARDLGPAARGLRPAARDLDDALLALRPFARRATPVVRDQLRPFSREATPTLRTTWRATRDLAAQTPALATTVRVLEKLVDTLAGDPAGADPAPLFWLAWANHLSASLFSAQDAHGPIRRGQVITTCPSLAVLEQIGSVNAGLGTLVALLDAPARTEVCPGAGGTR